MATLDYLIVGGGGSGYAGDTDTWLGGGGGGGEVASGNADISAGSYAITIGLGGTLTDITGGSSTFNGITAVGGGRGGGHNDGAGHLVNGEAGASGGGGSYYSGNNGVGGAATAGYAGSNAYGTYIGGCGGGFTSAGVTVTGDVSLSHGGEGYTSAITGVSDVYGSGGGGGWSVTDGRQGLPGGTNAGAGAGGASGPYPQTDATNPKANSGCGGGGRAGSGSPSNGAAGIVIIRYRTGDFGADSSGGTKTYTTSGGVNYTVHIFTSSETLVLTDLSGSMFLVL